MPWAGEQQPEHEGAHDQSAASDAAKPTASSSEQFTVDEEWKARVAEEKQKAEKQAKDSATQEEDDPPLPPPTLTALAGSLSMQALAALGFLPDPLTGEVKVRLNRARHLIDTINLLYERTSGTTPPEEKQALEQMLHELRLAFVQVQAAQKST